LTRIKFDRIKSDLYKFCNCIKNNRIKSDRINFDRIKSDRIKTDRIKSIMFTSFGEEKKLIFTLITNFAVVLNLNMVKQ
jgi:hypothetical protein